MWFRNISKQKRKHLALLLVIYLLLVYLYFKHDAPYALAKTSVDNCIMDFPVNFFFFLK